MIVGFVVKAPNLAHIMFRMYISKLDIVPRWIFPLTRNTSINPRWPPPICTKS